MMDAGFFPVSPCSRRNGSRASYLSGLPEIEAARVIFMRTVFSLASNPLQQRTVIACRSGMRRIRAFHASAAP
jgi:hypothetical protein